jgi:hypothetical protein
VEDASSLGELALVADRLGSSGAVAVGHGLTLVADLSLAGTGADHVLGMAKLRVRAVMGDPAAALVLEAELGGRFALGPTVDLRKVAFRLRAGPARLELGLLGQIDVRVGPDTLTFTGGLAVDARRGARSR